MLKRFAGAICGVALDMQLVNKMNVGWCIEKIDRFIADKKVCIIKMPPYHAGWVESPLCEWFEQHYSSFGFEEIAVDRTPKYLCLKNSMSFNGFPDYLVLRNGKWLRLEVECWSEQYLYTHSSDYADIVLCYAETKRLEGIETLEYYKIMGCEDIINQYEIAEYLYLNDLEFHKEYDHLMDLSIMKKMGLI